LTTTSRFPDKNELKRFARNFIKERIDSLQKDVMHCLQPPYAPFPTVLYCLATIDLFGGLLVGQVLDINPITKKRIHIDTAGNLKSYMELFMGYTAQQSELIIRIFRHKMVHLAQPRPIFSHNNKVVAWRYVHENTPDHLILKDSPTDSKIWIKSDWTMEIHQVFTIGISQLMEDIRDSALRHGGYLDQLDINYNNLLDKFEKAIVEAYTP
jgi:hypothetical protein